MINDEINFQARRTAEIVCEHINKSNNYYFIYEVKEMFKF